MIKGAKKIKVINPSTNKKLFDLTISTKKDVDLAVNSARKAQKNGLLLVLSKDQNIYMLLQD